MNEKFNPALAWFQENLPFFYAGVLSLWGGFVQYINKVRMGEKWSWSTLFFDLVVCSFAGLLAFFLCQILNLDGWKAAIVIAISAHEGTRGVNAFIELRNKFITPKI